MDAPPRGRLRSPMMISPRRPRRFAALLASGLLPVAALAGCGGGEQGQVVAPRAGPDQPGAGPTSPGSDAGVSVRVDAAVPVETVGRGPPRVAARGGPLRTDAGR